MLKVAQSLILRKLWYGPRLAIRYTALMTNNKHEGLIMENVKVLTIMLQKGKQRCKTMKTYFKNQKCYFLCWKMLLRVYDVSASYFPMFIVISCFGLAEFSASHLFRHNPPPTELLFQRPHNSRITHREKIFCNEESRSCMKFAIRKHLWLLKFWCQLK